MPGQHVVVRPGGLRQQYPAATRSATTLAVAFHGGDGQNLEPYLGVALAPLDASGVPGELQLAAPVATGPPHTLFRPQLLARPDGYWLAYVAQSLVDYGEWIGPASWARLDARGVAVDGPSAAGLEPCWALRAATSAAAEGPPGAPDSLALVCAERHLVPDEGIVEAHSVHVVVARSDGAASSPVTLDRCRNVVTPVPAVVWDGEAYDVLYLCQPGPDRLELRLARLDEAGALVAPGQALRDVAVSQERLPGQVGAAWDGSAIAVVWNEPGPADEPVAGPWFGRVSPAGVWTQAPGVLAETAPPEMGTLDLVPLAGGLALVASTCEIAHLYVGEVGVLCGITPAGTPAGCQRWSGYPCSTGALAHLALVPAGEGLRVIFTESMSSLDNSHDALFQVGWTPEDGLDGPPRPLAPDPGEALPTALGGRDRRALVLAREPGQHHFMDADRGTDHRLLAVDPETATVEHLAPPELEHLDYFLISDVDEDRVAVLVSRTAEETPTLVVLGANGAPRWSRDLGALLSEPVIDLSPHLEPGAVRVFFRYDRDDATLYDLVVSEGEASLPHAVGAVGPSFLAAHDGVYYTRAEVREPGSGRLDPSGNVVVHRYDPAVDDGFQPFARTALGPSLWAELQGLAAGPGVVAAVVAVDLGLTVLRWDAAGVPDVPCRLEGSGRDLAGGAATDDGVALLLTTPFVAGAPLLLVLPSVGAPRLAALGLPGPAPGYAIDVSPWTTPTALLTVWNDPASGDLLLSRFPW
jgi:hypothetical protein